MTSERRPPGTAGTDGPPTTPAAAPAPGTPVRPSTPVPVTARARATAWQAGLTLALFARPAWALALVGAVALATVFVLLGRWQYSRHEAKVERRDRVEASWAATVVPLSELLPRPGTRLAGSSEWRPVAATGRYESRGTVLVRNRPLAGAAGYEVLVPLRLDSGALLLVDRGWLPAGATARRPDVVPPPPEGPVTLVVRLRPGEPPASGPWPQGQALRIDLDRIGRGLTGPVHRAYGVLDTESPRPGTAPTPLPRPDVGLGPHLAYAVQWWGFAAVALVVPFVAAGREVRRRSPAAAPPARQGGVGAAGPVPSADGQVAEHER